MCAYEVTIGVMQGAEPGEISQTMMPVLAKTRLDAACIAERVTNMTLDATKWARAKFVEKIIFPRFPPFPPLGPTAVAA